ncbi:hypothetical protein [Aestuariivirga sp.]|uniref:hypothetical protein n=1 Tax=Aestuariivirga sp. TaxID=2650926 RepID=UPI00391BA7C4
MTAHPASVTTFILTLGSAAGLIGGMMLLVSRDPGLADCLSGTPAAQACSVRGGCSGLADRASYGPCGSTEAALARNE